MDLSAVIFVVLALAWAVYLIPKALQHHDDMASDRLLEGHSDKVRILSRRAKAAVTEVAEAIVPDALAAEVQPAPAVQSAPVVRPTREAARKAARRRRRVLGVLVLALVAVWTLTWFAYLPIWAPAVPGAMVVAWLVVARLSVRQQQRRRNVAARVEQPLSRAVSTLRAHEDEGAPTARRSNVEEFLDQLADEEDTTGLDRQEIEAALADEGSLWDPLPMTLPTYVSKARARRTVRTIELTGISSSGHDDTDTEMARQAAEAAEVAEESAARRRAAGA